MQSFMGWTPFLMPANRYTHCASPLPLYYNACSQPSSFLTFDDKFLCASQFDAADASG